MKIFIQNISNILLGFLFIFGVSVEENEKRASEVMRSTNVASNPRTLAKLILIAKKLYHYRK